MDVSPASIVVQRRIEWSDTDASGFWHNTAGFRLIETAETALLSSLGIMDEIYGRLPRASIQAEFKAALKLKDLLDCSIAVMDVGNTSLTYGFAITCRGELAMSATVVVVLLGADRKPTPWTAEHRELLLTAGPQEPELLSVS